MAPASPAARPFVTRYGRGAKSWREREVTRREGHSRLATGTQEAALVAAHASRQVDTRETCEDTLGKPQSLVTRQPGSPCNESKRASAQAGQAQDGA